MKKTILIAVFILAAAVASVYIFIPGRLVIVEETMVNANLSSVYRILSQDENWKKWWPGEKLISYNGQTYIVTGKIFNAFELTIQLPDDSLNSRLQLLPGNADSLSITWSGEMTGSNNPIKRYLKYRDAVAVKKNMNEILSSLKSFLEKVENIYGFTVKEITVTDSVLVSTRRSFEHKPGNGDIDEMIQSLRKYIAANKAVEKNFPMLNILKADSGHYKAMVAIAVDKMLPETKEFAPKSVLKGGHILEAQIQGGQFTIEKGMDEFENFRSDYKYISPAIPYQLLITDRMKEPDTTKWITKMYYPVL